MNKLIKASIAGAAGVALLLGGAGTFALWNDSVGVDSSAVQSGVLDIAVVANSTAWADVSPDKTTATFSPATNKIVPGDVITFKQSVTVTAEGKNLTAKLALSQEAQAVAAAFGGTIENSTEKVGTVVLTAARTAGDATIAPNADGTYTITPSNAAGASASTFDVTITVTFNKNTPKQVAQSLTAVDLSKISYSLTQVR